MLVTPLMLHRLYIRSTRHNTRYTLIVILSISQIGFSNYAEVLAYNAILKFPDNGPIMLRNAPIYNAQNYSSVIYKAYSIMQLTFTSASYLDLTVFFNILGTRKISMILCILCKHVKAWVQGYNS